MLNVSVDVIELLFGSENFKMIETLIKDKVYLYLDQSFQNMTISMMKPLGSSIKKSTTRKKDEKKKMMETQDSNLKDEKIMKFEKESLLKVSDFVNFALEYIV